MRSLVLLQVLITEARRRPGPWLASIASMACGVALFVAIALTTGAAESSFVSAVEAVSGKASHEVTAIGGLDERRYPAIAGHPAVEAAQPLVEGRAVVRGLIREGRSIGEGAPPLRLLGVDAFEAGPFLAGRGTVSMLPDGAFQSFLLQPSSGWVSRSWAQEAGAAVGDGIVLSVAGRTRVLTTLGLYDVEVLEEGARDTALVDLATAQELLSRLGKLDRIELILREDRVSDFEPSLLRGEILQRPERRGEQLASMISAFRLNLLALACLSVVVASLLVFNAAQYAVLRRTALLGQLRCLGANRRDLLWALLGETAVSGALGGWLGCGLGFLLAQGLVGRLSTSLTELYSFVRVELLDWSPRGILVVMFSAALLAALAGLLPALGASRASPRWVGLRSHEEEAYRLQLPRLLKLGIFWLALCLVALIWPGERWWLGVVAALALVGAGACWTPPVMGALLPRIARISEDRGGLLLPLSAGAVWRSLSRTGAAAAGLAIALAMTFGILIMVASFRQELDRWIEGAIRADLYVADASQGVARADARIPEEVVEELRGLPGLRGLDTLRSVEIPVGERTAPLSGVEWSLPESRRFDLLEGDGEHAFDAALAGAVLISEPLSRHHGLELGDRLEVSGSVGAESLEVVGIFRDYSSDRGLAITGAATFLELFGETGIRNVALYLEDNVDSEALAATLRDRFAGDYALVVRSNRQIREEVGAIFRRTFSVTYLLQTLATGMALVGIAVTLLGLALERGREIATLRAVGMSLDRLGRLFALESFWMASFPVLVSLPLGAALAFVLTAVINVRSFGWSIAFYLPWSSLLVTSLLALLAGLLASSIPLFWVRKQALAMALREE